MGVIKKMVTESKEKVIETKAANAAKGAAGLKASLIESASRALDTEYNKYANLRELLESANQIDNDRAALTVSRMKMQEAYLQNAKETLTEATITAGFQNLIPKLLDIVSKPLSYHFA